MYTFHKYWMPPTQDAIKPYVDFREQYNVPIWMGESGENTDDWIEKFRKVLDDDEISWTFWPYKKMHATSSPVTFAPPVHWDAIMAYPRATPAWVIRRSRSLCGHRSKTLARRFKTFWSRSALKTQLSTKAISRRSALQ